MQFISTVWQFRHLIVHKSWADFRADSKRNFLGVLWWLLDPIINVVIYYLCFGVFLGRGGGDYIPYLTIGIIGWMWFFSATTAGSSAIWANMALIRQITIPKAVFPISQIAVSSYRFFFSLIVLFSMLALWGYTPSAYWLLMPLIVLVEFLFIVGITFIFAAIVPFIPDLTNLIQYSFRLMMFLSCVMYKFDSLPVGVRDYLRFNPMVHVLEAYRDILMYHRLPDFAVLGAIAIAGIVGALLGLSLIHRLGPLYAKRVVR